VYALVRHTHDEVDTLGAALFCVTWLIIAVATALLWRPQSTTYFTTHR
jgi:hypothetical protein